MRSTVLCSCAALFILSIAPLSAEPDTPAKSDVEILADWLSGGFSSGAQAKTESAHYFHIRHFATRIWPERDDGPWLYVEQAAATTLNRPYRQRIYHLVAEGDDINSVIFALPGDPLRFAGAWQDTTKLVGLNPDQLDLLEGCEVLMHRREDGSFEGATDPRSCANNHAGATYATSEATVTGDELRSWDRGWDAEGQQVWGATKGPYRFLRTE